MNVRNRLSPLFPDRSPAWSEVFVATVFFVLQGTELIVDVLSGSVTSWPGVIAGFVLMVCGIAVMTSSLGTRTGQWFENSSVVVRAAVLIGVLCLSVSAPLVVGRTPYFHAVRVLLILYFLYVVAFVAWTGEVSGLKPRRTPTD